jgi:hypothetical protein
VSITLLICSTRRKLRSKCHAIYYHNQCKTLLSAPSLHPSDDTELLRQSHEESERLWSSHVKECHGKFCVLTECAPDPLGDLRHERTGNCKKTRGDVKQAEFNYLCYTLGVLQQSPFLLVPQGVLQLTFLRHRDRHQTRSRRAKESASDCQSIFAHRENRAGCPQSGEE